MNISFFVPGRPIGKKRHGTNPYNKRGFTPKVTKDYEKLIGQLALEARNNKASIYAPTDKIVNILVIIYYQNWQYLPDSSNVLKSIEDGMNGIIYIDDKQIAGIAVDRVLVDKPELVGAGVLIEERIDPPNYDQGVFR